MAPRTLLRSALLAATFLLANRDCARAQVTVPSLRIEPSARLKRASERPTPHEGSTISNGDTLLEVLARWRLRRVGLFVSLESSAAPEWFDPPQAAASFLRGAPISRPQMSFAPAGPRKLTIGLEQWF